ncbi:unnamed protein product [Polarella glacialis]|uniref:Dienelactone hydrolase domain-containing protein n=1 Tax=Polarella glacialis TaxID=89957 RepID=A0A813FFI0_POLGL|nr:unnamed protein product [Polarella glacialis]CAE8690238.1 unnamed protein product [Polarella glacialis]|mmetsp:Transcript_30077/g.53817  ORF Transcript_30077/g.53817 Transcript_30077/m.53817 type:complete len:384 (-) Transcript_30077:171-1322(-)
MRMSSIFRLVGLLATRLLVTCRAAVGVSQEYLFIDRPFGPGPIYEASQSLSERCRYPPAVGFTVPAFLYSPAPGALGPGADHQTGGVVLLHECVGIQKYVLQVAEALASTGSFTVLVLNVFRESAPQMTPVDSRYVSSEALAKEAEECMWKMQHLDWNAAVTDVGAAVAYLKRSRNVTGVATWGFSMGSALSLLSASRGLPHLAAAIAFYGFPDSETAPGAGRLFDPANVRVPVLAEFGDMDPFVGFSSPSMASYITRTLTRARVTSIVQHGCAHSFMNDEPWARFDGGEHVNETCRRDGLRSALEFLSRTLKVPLRRNASLVEVSVAFASGHELENPAIFVWVLAGVVLAAAWVFVSFAMADPHGSSSPEPTSSREPLLNSC